MAKLVPCRGLGVLNLLNQEIVCDRFCFSHFKSYFCNRKFDEKMAKQVVDFKPIYCLSEETSSILLRTADDSVIRQKKNYKTYEPSNKRLNFEIDCDGNVTNVKKDSLALRIMDNLRTREVTDPNEGKEKRNRKIGAVFMFSGSTDRIREMAWIERSKDYRDGTRFSWLERSTQFERWAKQLYMFLCQRFGKDNVVAVIAHLDIARPEVIAIVLAVGDGKYFSFNQKFAGEDKFEYRRRDIDFWNSLYAEVNQDWGLDRGDRHSVPSGHLYNASTIEVELLQKINNDNKALLAAKQKELKDLNEQYKQATQREKSLLTMLSNLEAQKKDLEGRIVSTAALTQQSRISTAELTLQRQQLINEQNAIIAKIQVREEQVRRARVDLQAVADKRSAKQKEVEIIKRSNPIPASESGVEAMRKMEAAIWEEFIKDGDRQYYNIQNISGNYINVEAYQNKIKKSQIKFYIDYGELIVSVATAIYMGDLTRANALAEKHGLRQTSLVRERYFNNSVFLEACLNEALSMCQQEKS